MWFGNSQHTVYQLASFHVRLRLGKEEARQMRVKVRFFRSLCPEGLWWDFSSKIVPLNFPELGFGTFCCRPRGNGKQDCWKSRFCMGCPITVTPALGDKSPLLVWDQKANCSLQRRASPLNLIPASTVWVSFSPSINTCENVERRFCIYLSMNSTHRQNQVLLSLPLWCILTANIPATGKQPFPSILIWEWSDIHHGELLILKLVQWLSRRCPDSFLLQRCRSSVSAPYSWRSVLHTSWCLKERTKLQTRVAKVKMQSSVLSPKPGMA